MKIKFKNHDFVSLFESMQLTNYVNVYNHVVLCEFIHIIMYKVYT